jgi:hypothetical protein
MAWLRLRHLVLNCNGRFTATLAGLRYVPFVQIAVIAKQCGERVKSTRNGPLARLTSSDRPRDALETTLSIPRADLRDSRLQLFSSQLFQQPLGLLQVQRVEAFGEPTVGRREEVMGFEAPALIAP